MSGVQNHPQIVALLNGDREIIRMLYKVLLPKLIGYVRSNQGTEEDAEEVFHQALSQILFRARNKGVPLKSNLEVYLFMACRNLWLQELTRRSKLIRNEFLQTKRDDNGVGVKEKEILESMWVQFEEKLINLPGSCNCLLRDYFNEMSYSEIVDKYGYANKNTAFQQIFKCKKKLKELIYADSKFNF